MSGDTFLVDLAQLKDMATGKLPRFANQFAKVSISAKTASGQAETAMGAIYGPWETLCGHLQRSAAETSRNLDACSEVLIQIGKDYATQDGLTAEVLAEHKQRLKNGTADAAPDRDINPSDSYGEAFYPEVNQ